MALSAAAFADQVERFEGTPTAKGLAPWNTLRLRLAANRGDESLAARARVLERSPRQLAALVTDLDRVDPYLLAALAGRRSLQDLAGVQPSGGRSPAPPTRLELVAREAAERHWRRCRTEPVAAKRREARWAGQREALRAGHLGSAFAALDATYGAACGVARQAAAGQRPLVAPPPGYRPLGSCRLDGVPSARWAEVCSHAAVEARCPPEWRQAGSSTRHQRPRLEYIARAAGRAVQLAGRRFAPRVYLSERVLRVRLRRALRAGPVATRRFLVGVASNPRRMAAAVRGRLDPILVASAIGPEAVAGLLSGRKLQHPGPLGRFQDALERAENDRLALVRHHETGSAPPGVDRRMERRALEGGLQGMPDLQLLSRGVVDRVWTGTASARDLAVPRDTVADTAYDAWRHRRALVVGGLSAAEIATELRPQLVALDASRGTVAADRDSERARDWTRAPLGDDSRAASPASESGRQPSQPLVPLVPPVSDSASGHRFAPRSDAVPVVPPVPPASSSPPPAGSPGVQPPSRPSAAVLPAAAAACRSVADSRSGPPEQPADFLPLPASAGVLRLDRASLAAVGEPDSPLPSVTYAGAGVWDVEGDDCVDYLVHRPDGSYDVVLHDRVTADIAPVDPASSESSLAALRVADGDAFARAFVAGCSSLDLPRERSDAALAVDPIRNVRYDGAEGQALRAHAASIGLPADARFASRSDIEAAGGRVAPDAVGVVLPRSSAVDLAPASREPLTFRAPRVVYHVQAETDPVPALDPARSATRGEAALEPRDLPASVGLVGRDNPALPATRYSPPASLATGGSRVLEDLELAPAESREERNSRLVDAAVGAALHREPSDGPAPPPFPAGTVRDDVDRDLVHRLAVDRVVSRIGSAYRPALIEPARRVELAARVRDPASLDRLSRAADAVATWLVDGARDRLRARGVETAHERRESSERAARPSGAPEPSRGGPAPPR